MSDLVIRDINSIKIHTFTDLVNYFIRVNGYEGQIECCSGITYRGEQVTSNSQPMSMVELIDPSDETTFCQSTPLNNSNLFSDIVRLDSIDELMKVARRYFFERLDNLGLL